MPTVDVAEQLARMPVQPLAAVLILRLVDDPQASPVELGRLVEMDPALSARVIRLANSPPYVPHSPVHSAARAVLLLGFSTVRGVAAVAVSGLLADNPTLGPPDHWAHSVSVAAGSAVAAGALGVAENEAFSAGLLHDVGTALLYASDPARYDEILATTEPSELATAERSSFGATHAEVGAEALEHWRFPRSFVQAVRTHHQSVNRVNALAQAIILGEALAEEIEALDGGEPGSPLGEIIDDLGLEMTVSRQLIDRTEHELGEIGNFLGANK